MSEETPRNSRFTLNPVIGSVRLSYRFCRFLCQWFSLTLLKTRLVGARNVPATGGVLLVSNHQSFMDPVIVAMGLPRECSYMARDSLFRNKLFGRLIGHLGAFPVKRGTADLMAIKESLRRLKRGEVVVVFPEGTRTLDGSIGPMLAGLATMAKKCKVAIVPTVIDGMFQAWPRHQALPGVGDVIIEYDRPILPAEYENLDPEALTEEIRGRMIAMQARRHRRMPSRRLKFEKKEG